MDQNVQRNIPAARTRGCGADTFVDVPDYTKMPFAMSDVALFAPGLTPVTADDLTDLLLAPTTARSSNPPSMPSPGAR